MLSASVLMRASWFRAWFLDFARGDRRSATVFVLMAGATSKSRASAHTTAARPRTITISGVSDERAATRAAPIESRDWLLRAHIAQLLHKRAAREFASMREESSAAGSGLAA